MVVKPKILVGVDGSDRAASVLAEGVKMARALGGSVILLRAIPNLHDLPTALPVPIGPLRRDMLQEADTSVRALAASVSPGVVEEILVEEDTPWRAICKAAMRLDAALIVVGAYGQSAVENMLGSTATRVVNHAPCNTLIVRTSAPA